MKKLSSWTDGQYHETDFLKLEEESKDKELPETAHIFNIGKLGTLFS